LGRRGKSFKKKDSLRVMSFFRGKGRDIGNEREKKAGYGMPDLEGR